MKSFAGWVILASLLITENARADSNWKYVAASSNNAVWYVDMESIRNVSDGYDGPARKAWIKIDFSAVKSEIAREQKQLVFFKCEVERAKTLTFIRYKADGSVLESYTFPVPGYRPVVPETVLQGAMEVVCSANQ